MRERQGPSPESGQLVDLGGWGGVRPVLRGLGLGAVIQNETSPYFRFSEAGISDN